MCILRTLEPRTEKEIEFERKKLTFRILPNWWRFDCMVSSSLSAKDSGADECLIFSIYCPDGTNAPSLAARLPYWIIVHEIACHYCIIAFSVLSSRVLNVYINDANSKKRKKKYLMTKILYKLKIFSIYVYLLYIFNNRNRIK